MSRSMRKAGVLLAATLTTTALTASTLTQPATAAPEQRATTDSGASVLAAQWLREELNGGLMGGAQPDFGLTLDTGFALAQAGDMSTVSTISAAVEPRLSEYVGDAKEVYGGPTAKAATFARVARAEPTSYGGMNLITRLEGQIQDAAGKPTATDGRLFDTSQYGDFANVVGQSYAVRALSLSHSKEAGNAVEFLLKQQCASGAFRLNFSKPAEENQACVEGAVGSEADPDATAIAVINLVESNENAKPVQDSLAAAGAWLAAQQRPSGAFRGGPSTRGVNTNSTSLAGYALGLLKNRDAAMRAAVWVRKRQPVDKSACRSALSRDLGAVAYKQSALRQARTAGITAEATDEWRRATAQAVSVLQYAPASPDALSISSARRRAQAGDRIAFRVFGIAPGERACVQIKGDFKRVTGKATGGKLVRSLRMPTGNRGRFASVRTGDDKARTWIRVRN